MKVKSARPVEKRLTKLPAARAALDAYGAQLKLSNARIEKLLTDEAARLNAAAKTTNKKLEEFINQADELFGTGDAGEEDPLFVSAEPLEDVIDQLELPDDDLKDQYAELETLIDEAEAAHDDEEVDDDEENSD